MEQQKLILIVDDSKFDRDLLAKALIRKSELKVIEASTSEQCLELLKSEKIDLILMDIIMPGTIGTEALKLIRDQFNPVELPIIMITALKDVSDVVKALSLGANDYLIKPLNFDIVLSKVETHLKFSETSREMARLQEIAALHAMISTYNHEINNPLTIALGGLNKLARDRTDDSALKKTEEALWRVAEIVKKIREVTEKHHVDYQTYTGASKMVKLRKTE